MTYDDDFVRFILPTGQNHDVFCKSINVDWPPPETLTHRGLEYRRERFSAITDEQRDGMSHVCRGAEYRVIFH